MATITPVRYSDWAFTNPSNFNLPTRRVVIGANNIPQSEPVGNQTVSVDVPADAEAEYGFIAFTYITQVGLDPSIDIQFSLDGHWTLATTLAEFRSMHWAVSVVPGITNYFNFNLDKGGKVGPDPGTGSPEMSFGGFGQVIFQNICLFYHRVRQEQDSWKWCHKCQGLFVLNPGSVCPAGGSHDSTSGDYLLRVK